MKPLLPALDAAGLLREAGFALLLRDRRPVEVADLAAAIGIDPGAADAAVTTLAEAGWLDLDDSGRVVGAAGLSLATGPHRLTLCTPTVLLCGKEHGAAWAEDQGGHGALLDLAEGARQGGADWAGCVNAIRRLS